MADFATKTAAGFLAVAATVGALTMQGCREQSDDAAKTSHVLDRTQTNDAKERISSVLHALEETGLNTAQYRIPGIGIVGVSKETSGIVVAIPGKYESYQFTAEQGFVGAKIDGVLGKLEDPNDPFDRFRVTAELVLAGLKTENLLKG